LEEELFFRESGRVKSVYVERDDMVEEGTLLAELENEDLKRQLAQAEIAMEEASLKLQKAEDAHALAVQKSEIDLEIDDLTYAKMEESLASLRLDTGLALAALNEGREGPSAEDLAIARAQLEKAQNSLWSAQVSRDSTCGQTKGAACDGAQANVQRAEADLRIAEINYQRAVSGPDEDEIAKLEAKYQQALRKQRQAELDMEIYGKRMAKAELDFSNLKEEIDPQLTKAVERNELSIERLTAQLDNTVITSPIDGKVTSVSAYEGREVPAFKTVFVVADESELEVTAEPMSSQLQRLSEGMSAQIILSAYPGKDLEGEIIQLPYPYGRGGGSSVEEVDKQTHISFDPEDLDIGPGDLVKVIVTIERKEDALWLPPAAIRTFAGRKFVVVEEEGRQRRVDITVGIESAERIEIVDGLEEGQIVIGQ
jgi:multidrug resistance efflux pump